MLTLAARIEQSAVEFGNTAAVIAADGTSLTYADLRDQTRHVAAALGDSGIRRGNRVAVLLPGGMEQTVCILGVASHTACIPLDPATTESELERILKETEAVALITGTGEPTTRAELAARLGIDWMWLERPAPAHAGRFHLRRAAAGSVARRPAATQADQAIILCTSGSTSRPKLAPQTQEGIVTAALDLARWFQLTPADRCLGCMPLFHGNGLYAGLLPVIVSGGSFISLDSFNPDEFFRCLDVHDPTWLTTIPTYLQMLLRHAHLKKQTVIRNRLRFIRAGSAHLSSESRDATERLLSVPVLAGYGSAEAAHITNNPLPPRERKDDSVGLPCGNEVRVLDADGNELEAGEMGEVVVRGPSVTTGYLGAAGINDDLFLDGWLRTGDQGRFDAEGYLTLVGRTKQMINRGGESLSPIEIEDVMTGHPLVAEAAVFAVAHPTLGENIAAAVVPRPGARLSQAELQRYLGKTLSPRKVPYRIVELQELPTNRIGKVDQVRLAEIFRETRGPAAAPRTDVQKTIARIWRATLDVEGVGATDHFVELGGDSISALSVLLKIKNELGVDLQPSDVLQAGTVEELERVVLAAKAPAVTRERPAPAGPILPRAATDPAPLSFPEFGLWIVQQMDPDDVTYNSPLAIRFTGALNTEVLAESLQALVCRQETLRTTFAAGDDEPTRVIHAEVTCALEMDDLRSCADANEERQRHFERLANAEIRRPFDLSQAPPIRSRLFRIDDQTHVLVLTLHHIITDGWSTGVIVRELCALYRAGVQSERAALPVLPIQYADFAAWQRGREKVFEKRLPFWRQRLAGQPTRLHLAGASAGGHSGSAWQSPQGATVSRRSTGGLGEAARLLSRRLGTTQFVMLEAAFKVLLHRHCGDADISVGTPAANRGYRALDHLVGCFISMLVLRSDLSGNPSFEELVKRERERCYTAYVHQEVPFQMLVRDIAPRRELGVHPLFQVLFSLRTLGGIDLSGSGVHGERVHLHNGTAKYDLSVEATVRDDGEIDLWAEYRVERFEAATVAGWLEEYEALLRAVATDPGRSIADLK